MGKIGLTSKFLKKSISVKRFKIKAKQNTIIETFKNDFKKLFIMYLI